MDNLRRIVRRFPLNLSLGTDICQITRIRKILTTGRAQAFVRKILTEKERTHPKIEWILEQTQAGKGLPNLSCLPPRSSMRLSIPGFEEPQKPPVELMLDQSAKFMAGRFAAKEAVIKAHPYRPLTWSDITIDATPDAHAQRDGSRAAIIRGEGDEDYEALVSISHDGDYATATCLASVPPESFAARQVPEEREPGRPLKESGGAAAAALLQETEQEGNVGVSASSSLFAAGTSTVARSEERTMLPRAFVSLPHPSQSGESVKQVKQKAEGASGAWAGLERASKQQTSKKRAKTPKVELTDAWHLETSSQPGQSKIQNSPANGDNNKFKFDKTSTPLGEAPRAATHDVEQRREMPTSAAYSMSDDMIKAAVHAKKDKRDSRKAALMARAAAEAEHDTHSNAETPGEGSKLTPENESAATEFRGYATASDASTHLYELNQTSTTNAQSGLRPTTSQVQEREGPGDSEKVATDGTEKPSNVNCPPFQPAAALESPTDTAVSAERAPRSPIPTKKRTKKSKASQTAQVEELEVQQSADQPENIEPSKKSNEVELQPSASASAPVAPPIKPPSPTKEEEKVPQPVENKVTETTDIAGVPQSGDPAGESNIAQSQPAVDIAPTHSIREKRQQLIERIFNGKDKLARHTNTAKSKPSAALPGNDKWIDEFIKREGKAAASRLPTTPGKPTRKANSVGIDALPWDEMERELRDYRIAEDAAHNIKPKPVKKQSTKPRKPKRLLDHARIKRMARKTSWRTSL